MAATTDKKRAQRLDTNVPGHEEMHVTLWVASGTTTKEVSKMLEKALPEHDIDCDYFSVR